MQKKEYYESAERLFEAGYITGAMLEKIKTNIYGTRKVRKTFEAPSSWTIEMFFMDVMVAKLPHPDAPPIKVSLEDIREEASQFSDFYESKGWMVGSNKMKDWKAAARRWIRSNLKNGNSTKSSPHNSGKPNKTQGQQVGIPSGASSGNVDMAAVLRRGSR